MHVSEARLMITLKRIVLGAMIAAAAAAASYAADADVDAPEITETTKPVEIKRQIQTGLAAYYHATFQGRRTACGESFNHNALTAAHKTLPFGTLVRVVNLRNRRSVIVRVNDRGPMEQERIIDLTHRAAQALGFVSQGMTRVTVEVVAASETANSDAK